MFSFLNTGTENVDLQREAFCVKYQMFEIFNLWRACKNRIVEKGEKEHGGTNRRMIIP